ncbi:MAG: ABC transporter ATP-binding protein [Chloroflexota bacterium]
MINIVDISKRFGHIAALNKLNLQIPAGSIYGLIGPNGAGKSTLLRLLVGLVAQDAGSIDISCLIPDEIGYLPERPRFPTRFTISEYLRLLGTVSGISDIDLGRQVRESLDMTGLASIAHRRMQGGSKGMLQRLALAQAIMDRPELLILDEPFAGLDPGAQAAMRDVLLQLNRNGSTILLSTHRLADVTQVCTHLAILSRGHIIRKGLMEEVIPGSTRVILTLDNLATDVQDQISAIPGDIRFDGNSIDLPDGDLTLKNAVIQVLISAGIDVTRLERKRVSLEETYIAAISGGLVEEEE